MDPALCLHQDSILHGVTEDINTETPRQDPQKLHQKFALLTSGMLDLQHSDKPRPQPGRVSNKPRPQPGRVSEQC